MEIIHFFNGRALSLYYVYFYNPLVLFTHYINEQLIFFYGKDTELLFIICIFLKTILFNFGPTTCTSFIFLFFPSKD